MRIVLSCVAILMSTAAVQFNLADTRNASPKPKTEIVVDLEPQKPILTPIPNHFCDEEYLGEWDVMKCEPRDKDMRHEPELFSQLI